MVSGSWWCKWVTLWSLWAARLVRQPTTTLRVSGGLLRGETAHDGSHVSYLGVPYATIPHRFKAPGPEPIWEGIFDAIDEHIRCPQRVGDSILIGREDCLVLNVYTPVHSTPHSKLPVMFFIHGGGFFQGSGSKFLYGPNYLVPKHVILVTINYRLNIQGFLCLRTKDAPGNAGMKDQVAALKWVRRNIRVFGGDPENVTIFGESAGGAAVSYHVLSPMSAGLFHRAILQSGSSLTPWAIQFRPVYMASLLARAMRNDTQDPHELYDLFMSKTDSELVLTRVPRKRGNIIVSEVCYVPCVEDVIDGEEPFLTDVPYKLLSRGEYNKVPMIIGTNNEEGYLFVALENDTILPTIEFEKSLPKDLVIQSETERKEIAERFKLLYLGKDEVSSDTMLEFSKLHGELYFHYPALEETELVLKTNEKPVFNYLFKYDGWRNLAKLALGRPYALAPGATHADELFYLFKVRVAVSMFESEMIERMTTMWTNFAKFGDPTPAVTPLLPSRWPPTSVAAPRVFTIDDQLGSGPLWHSESLLFWRRVYAKYRRTSD